MPVRVLVVDDHAVFAQLFVEAVRRAGYDGLAGDPAALDDDELVALAAAASPTIVVLDLVLGPGRSGLTLIDRFVAAGCDVVVLTAYDEPAVRERALSAGAGVALDKLLPLERILEAIETIAPPGEHEPLPLLTPRERQVLAGLVAGRSAKDIASDLGIAVPTVRTQIRSVYRKLGVNNQRAAILVAVRAGWSVNG